MEEPTGGTKPIKCSEDQKRQKYGRYAAGSSSDELLIGNSDAPPHLEEEKRRLESEAEMTRMLLQCQMQIASFLSARQGPNNRKRKRVQEEEPSPSVSLEMDGALLLSLIQLNMITF
ncbi:hypothetical protein SDJN02_03696, partial [Cucurbita argyrosperma subsp. argyrosperma]